jgi:hypothetical protein
MPANVSWKHPQIIYEKGCWQHMMGWRGQQLFNSPRFTSIPTATSKRRHCMAMSLDAKLGSTRRLPDDLTGPSCIGSRSASAVMRWHDLQARRGRREKLAPPRWSQPFAESGPQDRGSGSAPGGFSTGASRLASRRREAEALGAFANTIAHARGQCTATGPMPVTISRSGRFPWRTSRWRPVLRQLVSMIGE